MTLRQYLEARSETPSAFARRAHMSRQALHNYLDGSRIPNGPAALRLIQATRREPAPGGGTVTLEDLCSESTPVVAQREGRKPA